MNIRCSTVTHQVGPLPIKSVEPSKLLISNSFSGNRYGVETHGWSFSATLAFSPTYHKSMLRNRVTWFYDKSIELNYIEGTFCLNLNTLMGIAHDNFVQQKR